VGTPLLAFGSLTFAFSTILGWCLYGERGMEYVASKLIVRRKRAMGVEPTSKYMEKRLKGVNNAYRIVFLITVYLGAVISLDLVWNLADIFNALMAIPNLLCLLFLSGVIVKETRKYLWSGRIDE